MYIPLSALVAATLLIGACSPCTKFVKYQRSVVDVEGIELQLGEQPRAKAGKVRVDPKNRDASEMLQHLDQLQYSACLNLERMEPGPAREQERSKYQDTLRALMRETNKYSPSQPPMNSEPSPPQQVTEKKTEEPKPEPVAHGVRYQDFPRHLVEVEDARGNNRSSSIEVTIFLSYVNKTDKELLFAMIEPSVRTFLLDSKGNRYTYKGSSGIAHGWYGMGRWAHGTTMLRISPRERATASLTFYGCCRKDDFSKLSPFAFSSEQAFVEDEKPVQNFNVSIRNVEVK